MSRTVFCGLFLFSVYLLPAPARSAQGDRPRNVAVTPDGSVALVTSMGSNYVTQVSLAGPGAPQVEDRIDVQSASWGIAWVEDCDGCPDENPGFVVTHPGRGVLTYLTANGSGVYNVRTSYQIPMGCTEVIVGPDDPWKVLLANRGAPPSNAAGSWQHSVLYFDLSTGSLDGQPFVAEREPRVLALSPWPEDRRLFVGHAQGDLRLREGTELSENHPLAAKARDGGSILEFDFADRTVVDRFAIGSPVRGLAVLPPIGAPSGSEPSELEGGYRLFFTHVGDGSHSEDPGFGGRAIPNVISSLSFDADGEAVSRQNTIVNHTDTGVDALGADLDPIDASATDLPTVLPEKLALRWIKDGNDYDWELWVGNSGSGTVTHVSLEADSLPVDGSIDLTGEFPVVLSRESDGHIDQGDVDLTADETQATVVYDFLDGATTIHVGASSSGDNTFGSNPRGILFSSGNSHASTSDDAVYVVTQLDNQLVPIDAAAISVGTKVNVGAGCSTALCNDERDFFTFGRGFDFREPGGIAVGASAMKVNNISCGTCHVEGHIDGKVRLTVRRGDNTLQSNDNWKPVAVPSIFDTGSTEWIFFEGLRTVVDGEDNLEALDDDAGCNYCQASGFFFDTQVFTDVVSSPPSPFTTWNPSTQMWDLDDSQSRGRGYFELMNCNRCHGGPTAAFCRTNEEEFLESEFGPLPGSTDLLLHDPTQVFVTRVPASTKPGGSQAPLAVDDGVSLRNMTDVGTRPAGDGRKIGINTPALAGAWDNAPFMHDGRYRTLETVLDHTWVNDAWGARAAPVSTDLVPDNAFNSVATQTTCDLGNPQHVPGQVVGPLFQFGTHADGSPGTGRASVSEFLDGITVGGQALDDLVAFLKSASSRSDICNETNLTVSSISVTDETCTSSILSWSTSFAIPCRVTYEVLGSGSPEVVFTAAGTGHAVTVPTDPGTAYKVRVIAESPLCGLADVDSLTWTPAPEVVSPITAQNQIDCTTDLSWTTTEAVACSVRWGQFGTGMPNSFVTSSGTSHGFTATVVQTKKYEIEVKACGDVEYRTWKAEEYCLPPEAPGATAPVLSTAPNPFSPSTRIQYRVLEPGHASMRIFSVSGRLVRTLVDGDLAPGVYEHMWSGTTDTGGKVGTGIYYLIYQQADRRFQKKLVLF